MAEFRMLVQEDEELEVVTVWGDLQSGEMLRFAKTGRDQKRKPHVIWDLRQTSWRRIPPAELYLKFDAARRNSKPGYKTAMVFGNDADFGLGKMIEHYMETQGSCEQFRAFKDLENAEIWLKSVQLDQAGPAFASRLHR